ncbi:MAG: 50S ribosomal protein L10 [Candidatus Komeilibacteria bacterium]
MAKNKEQKQAEVKALQAKLEKAKSVVFTAYAGLSVGDMESLRGEYRTADVEYKAAKKRLLDLALTANKVDHESIVDMEGSIATAFGMEDEVAPARVSQEFAKKHDNFSIRAGLLKVGEDWKFLSAEEVIAMASLPSREELLAKVVGSINAPVSGFVKLLAGNVRSLLNVLNAIQETKS